MAVLIDLTGQRFGRLVAMWPAGRKSTRRVVWLCCCDCGRLKLCLTSLLRNGNSRSCGCLRRENCRRTGLLPKGDPWNKRGCTVRGRATPTYSSWRSMLQRCGNPHHKFFHNYGGRGVTICDRWREEHGFENFLADMGERPLILTLDRINNDGNYEPNNCRWATRKEQCKNKRPCTPKHARNISIGKRRAIALRKLQQHGLLMRP